jgi:hypothetical protein
LHASDTRSTSISCSMPRMAAQHCSCMCSVACLCCTSHRWQHPHEPHTAVARHTIVYICTSIGNHQQRPVSVKLCWYIPHKSPGPLHSVHPVHALPHYQASSKVRSIHHRMYRSRNFLWMSLSTTKLCITSPDEALPHHQATQQHV